MIWRSKNYFKNNVNGWIWFFFLGFAIGSYIAFRNKAYDVMVQLLVITHIFLGWLVFTYARFPRMKTYDKYCSRFEEGALNRATDYFNLHAATNIYEYTNPMVFWGYDIYNATHMKRIKDAEDGSFEGMYRTNLVQVTVVLITNRKMYVYSEKYDALKKPGKDKLGIGGYIIPLNELNDICVCGPTKVETNSFLFIGRPKDLPKLQPTGVIPYETVSMLLPVYDYGRMRALVNQFNEHFLAEKREELAKNRFEFRVRK